MRHRERRDFDAFGARRVKEGAGAALGIMQHGLNRVCGKGLAHIARQARQRSHPVSRHRDDVEALGAELAGEIARKIGARITS